MANHRQSGLERRPRGDGAYAAGRQADPVRPATAWPAGSARPRRAAPAVYRQPPVEETICADCGGTGVRAASLDPYCGYMLSCRSCMGTTSHQDRMIFLMQLAFGCGVGLITLAVVLL